MRQSTALSAFIQSRPHLVWYVNDASRLSEASIVEHTLNYGDWRDVRALIALLGIQRVAEVYFSQRKGKRNNYRPAIAHYFDLYFARHAAR
ncbi:MAG: hypothetical protein IPJ68_04830 [Candidatus Moraniibacteriota bacterium]|nr:MAG: hypothetical protein IPJ68_04830 [Candidatus Moranbacteria bacterium]